MNYTENEFNNSNNTNNGVNNNFNPQTGKVVNNDNIKKIIFGVIALAVLVGGFFGIKALFGGGSNSLDAASLSKTTAFKLEKDGKYALFNKDGNRLTDFVYKTIGEFFNGSAVVTGENREQGVISQSGKMIIPTGKYILIQRYGGLYRLYQNGTADSVLADTTGKIINDLKSDKLVDGLFYYNNYFVTLENNNSYIFMNFKGTKFLTVAKNKSDSAKPDTKEKDGLVSIFYNGKNYVYNAITGKKIVEFSDNNQYCVNSYNTKNQGEVILNQCVGTFSKPTKDFKYVSNGAVKFESKDECKNLTFESKSNNIICSQDNYYITLYNTDGSKTQSVKESSISYNSYNSYVIETSGRDNKVDFYENGKLSKTVNCFNVNDDGYTGKDIYALSYNSGLDCKKVDVPYDQYFKSNGEPLNNDTYKFVYPFDQNGLGNVSDNNSIHSLIDVNGKVISTGYSEILTTKINYVQTVYYNGKKGDKSVLFDTKGTELVIAKAIQAIKNIDNTLYAQIIKADGDYALYNTKTKKDVIVSKTSISMYDNYVKSKDGTKTNYYTYSGKLFYTN